MFALIISLLLTAVPDLHFHHKGVESGLAQLAVNGLYQDENGTLWVGTREGIKYCEGSLFYPLPLAGHDKWVMSNRVPTICGDGRGSLFINANYNVLRYDLSGEHFDVLYTQDNTASPPEISMQAGRSGLWIGCAERILLWNRDKGLSEIKNLNTPGVTISSLLELGDTLFIGTKKNGLIAMRLAGGDEECILPCNEVLSLFADSRNRLWCSAFNQGVFCLEDGRFTPYNSSSGALSICDDYVRTMAEDSMGRIWLGTSRGVDILDLGASKVLHQGMSSNGHPGLSNLSIWSLLKDRSGTMWIGTYFGGLDYCLFEEESPSLLNLGISGSIFATSFFASGKYLWIATEGKGLIRFDGDHAHVLSELPFSLYNIKDFLADKDSSSIWISTHMGGLWHYNTSNGKTRHYTINPKDNSTRSECVLSSVFFGDNIFIGTLQGVYELNPRTGVVNPIPEINRHIYEADRMLVSSDSESIWIVGNTICRYSPSNGVVESYSHSLEALSAGGTLTSTSIIETTDGSIYVGTAGSGLLQFDRDKNTFTKATVRNSSFSSDYIGALHECSDGRLLIGTGKGLCCYDPVTCFVDNYEPENGFPLLSMFPGQISRVGEKLFLCGSNGIAVSSEKQLKGIYKSCSLSLCRLLVNGEPVRPGDKSGILEKGLRYSDRISLPYYKNDLAFIVGSDYPSRSNQVRYMYRLEGFENSWHTQSLSPPIHYPDLPPGKYQLHIRNTITPNDDSVLLNISVRPPFYSTAYAWLLYLVLILAIVAFVVYFFITKIKLTTSLTIERERQAEAEKNSRQKIRFFTNMSHELRTPLTLLIGRLELFRDKHSLTTRQKAEIDKIHNAASEMMGLVNTQMDVLKMGENALSVNPTKGDLVGFVRSIVEDFQVLVAKKHIILNFESAVENCYTSFDHAMLKKVFVNLLSNAIKYTSQGKGIISVSVSEPVKDLVRVSVKDNGIGIDPSEKNLVFNRFFRSENDINKDPATTGTGIGLYLSSHIMRMHGGSIELDSQPGKGSTFTVCLPIIEEAPKAEQEARPNDEPVRLKAGSKAKRILVVEDESNIRMMLRDILGDQFEVFEADNGKSGLQAAEAIGPDLIISDIMMPVMSGDVFCRTIKSSFTTCHIPVILLTAMADDDNIISGYDCGADDYITKPFNARLLVARCVGIINNRSLLQKRYSTDINTDSNLLSDNKDDIAFMDKLVAVIEENIMDNAISVPSLCEHMAMGHTKLFNKIKGLTGKSPQDFIQTIRMKYAAKTLREQSGLSVSDIAFQMGFSSLNYFEKCFKKAFGQTPSSFRRNSMITQNNEQNQ